MNTEAATAPEAAAVAAQGAPGASKKTASKKKATRKAVAPKAAKTAKKAKSAPKETASSFLPRIASLKAKSAAKQPTKAIGRKATPPAKAAGARDGSKKAIILDLMRRKNGATLAEIAKATDWQNHSIRGLISTLGKNLTIESTRSEAGERTYRIA